MSQLLDSILMRSAEDDMLKLEGNMIINKVSGIYEVEL